MPAPALVVTQNATYTIAPFVVDGWRISTTLSQPGTSGTGNWNWSMSVALAVAADVDNEDEGHRDLRSGELVFNEFPSLAAAVAELQAIADDMVDRLPVDAA